LGHSCSPTTPLMGVSCTLGARGRPMAVHELARLSARLRALAIDCPSTCHQRTSRFGSPLVLSRLDWVRPDLVAEVAFLTGPTMACYGMSSIRAPRRQAGDGGCGASLLLASSQLCIHVSGAFPSPSSRLEAGDACQKPS
jgi:hypothetical protein